MFLTREGISVQRLRGSLSPDPSKATNESDKRAVRILLECFLVSLLFCLSICLSASFFLSVCLSDCVHLCISFYFYPSLSIQLCACMQIDSLSLRLYTCICMHHCLSIVSDCVYLYVSVSLLVCVGVYCVCIHLFHCFFIVFHLDLQLYT